MDYKKVLMNIADTLGMKEFKLEEEVEAIEMVEIGLENDVTVYAVSALDLGIQLYTDPEMTIILEDGEYVTTDGTKFEVIDTVVGSIEEKEAEEPAEDEAPVTEELDADAEPEVTNEPTEENKFIETELVDGVILYHDIALDTEDAEISVYTDVDMTIPAGDGEYTTVDGMILTVVDGKITDIRFMIEENTEMKTIITELEKDNVDLKTQIEELEKKNEQLSKIEISLRSEIDNKPAVGSINFGEEDEVEVEKDAAKNRQYAKFVLKQIKK